MNSIIFSSKCIPNEEFRDRLIGLLPYKAKVSIIPADFYSGLGNEVPLREGFFRDVGFSRAKHINIGAYFDENARCELFDSDAIFLSGGNTFELLFMLKLWDLIPDFRKYAKDGGIVMGASAGGIVQGTSAAIAGFADFNWLGLKDLDAMALVPFQVKPHWDRWQDEIEMFKEYKKANGVEKLYGLKEGQVIWTNDDGTTFYGGDVIEL